MNASKAGPYGGEIRANYPRNEWWIAATSDEITRAPKRRWLLDSPVVLYRKQDGGVVALYDRCPHRWAPLSKGWLDGDDIVCAYHGFQYCPEGSCVKVPVQETPPPRARVQSYRIIERAPLVWIWMGDPARAHERTPPELPWLHDSGWSGGRGYMDLAANYMLLKENVLDLTHFGYLHRRLGITDWIRTPEVTVEDGQVEFRLEFPAAPAVPDSPEGWVFGNRPVSYVDWGRSRSPALLEGGRDYTDPDPPPGARNKVAYRIMHATTPISPTRMHYFWAYAYDMPLSQEQIDSITAATVLTFDEDRDMLTAVQDTLERDRHGADYPEVILATDRSIVQARLLLRKQLEAEQRDDEDRMPAA